MQRLSELSLLKCFTEAGRWAVHQDDNYQHHDDSGSAPVDAPDAVNQHLVGPRLWIERAVQDWEDCEDGSDLVQLLARCTTGPS